MLIKIFTDIDDPVLVKAWREIVDEYQYFPQSAHGWCAPWWRRLSKGRLLHVVAVLDETGDIIAIAPMCIERLFLGRVLRSFPIHFADFFTLLAKKDGREESARACMLEYMLSFANWDLVRIDQINTEDPCYPLLLAHGYAPKKLTDIMIADIDTATFDEYLKSFSSNHRKMLKKKIVRMRRDYEDVRLVRIDTYEEYEKAVDKMKEVYERRWRGRRGNKHTEQDYACRNEAVSMCFDRKQMLLFLLQTNETIIAFVLGFIDDSCYYIWRVSHDPAFNRYSPGIVIRNIIIEHLMGDVSCVNFMAGGYEYKRSLAQRGKITENYIFLAKNDSFAGRLLFQYYIKWRDRIKLCYNWILSVQSKCLSMLSKEKKKEGSDG